MITKRNLIDSFFSYLPKGCSFCKHGSKMVLFITGICYQNCFYCPLSEDKKNKDDIFANQYKISSDEEIISIAKEMNANGTGITGGEPLIKINRVLKYINLLKMKFGKYHHIHLYTSIPASFNTLYLLSKVGLDEIRFHPPYKIWKYNKKYLKQYIRSIKIS